MAGLLDGVNDWFSGQDMAGQNGLYRPEDYAAARNQLLMQLGAGLMAPRAERGQILAGIPQGYRESLQGGLKERMLGERVQGWSKFKEDLRAGKFGNINPAILSVAEAAGPEAGLGYMADYLTKTPAKLDFTTLVAPDGTTRSFDVTDPTQEAEARRLAGEGWTERASGGVNVNVGDKMNESQSRAAVILPRLRFGVTALEEQDKALLDPKSAILSRYGAQYFTSPEYKQAKQVGRQFLAAILRLESGATIGAEELDQADQTYLPQPGDPPAVIEQKRLARRQIYEGVVTSLGNRQDIAEPIPPPADKPVVDDVADIPEGATVTDNNTGKRYKKVGGQLVPVQ